MTTQHTLAKRAIQNYRDLCAIQARMPDEQKWTMGAAIRQAKLAAYVEIEAAKATGE